MTTDPSAVGGDPPPPGRTTGAAGRSSGTAGCDVCGRSLTDDLTGVLDRRAWDSRAGQALARARRRSRPAALILADLDRFKTVNDAYGHPAGDAVLRAVGAVLRQADGGIVGRYGGHAGDEFLILLPDTAVDQAMAVARRLQHSIRMLSITARSSRRTTVAITGQTISMGISAWLPCAPSGGGLPDLLLDSDTALREAKHGGGDQVRAVRSDVPAEHSRVDETSVLRQLRGRGEVRIPLTSYRLDARRSAADLVLSPAAAEHLHTVLGQLLGRDHAVSPVSPVSPVVR